jgi:hypothetical protein
MNARQRADWCQKRAEENRATADHLELRLRDHLARTDKSFDEYNSVTRIYETLIRDRKLAAIEFEMAAQQWLMVCSHIELN